MGIGYDEPILDDSDVIVFDPEGYTNDWEEEEEDE